MRLEIPNWTLEKALNFIRELQVKAWENNLHLALAGSVLNKGMSDNDLDIIVMGQNNELPHLFDPFLKYLANLGKLELKTGPDYETENRDIYGLMFTDGNQIDFFIYDMKNEQTNRSNS